jgi:hypothetical protein
MAGSSKAYEVVYIDKFSDMASAELARESLKRTFGLNDQVISTLSSGVPIVVKKDISWEEAQKFEQAIKHSGAMCWVQEMSPDGGFHERRHELRRSALDRRETVRGSSILPDRRYGIGRRSDEIQRH